MSYDPIPECHVCGSRRVKSSVSLCHRCVASYMRKGAMSDTMWAASRARMFLEKKGSLKTSRVEKCGRQGAGVSPTKER